MAVIGRKSSGRLVSYFPARNVRRELAGTSHGHQGDYCCTVGLHCCWQDIAGTTEEKRRRRRRSHVVTMKRYKSNRPCPEVV